MNYYLEIRTPFMKIESDEDSIIIRETRKGKKRDYYYIEREGELRHISSIGTDIDGKGKRTKVKIPKSQLEQEEIFYNMGRTNSRTFIPSKYRLIFQGDEVETEKAGSVTDIDLSLSDIAIIGSERDEIKEYKNNVPEIVERINSVRNGYGFDFFYGGGKATRSSIEDEPNKAVVSSLMFHTPRGRSQSLNARIRSIHEVFGVTEAIDAIATNVEGNTEDTVWLKQGSESAILDTPRGPATMCYQFSLIRSDEVPFSPKERRFVRPDLVIFPGNWHHDLDDLREEVPMGTIIVDMKHKPLDDKDIAQLTGYTNAIPESTRIVASLEPISEKHKDTLEEIEWKTALLSPDNSQPYQAAVQEALEKASWNRTVEIALSPSEVPDLSELAELCASGSVEQIMERLDADKDDLYAAIGKRQIESTRDCLQAITLLGGE